MPRIENEVAAVEVKTLAAEITSFYDKEKNIEHMWQGDPQFWAGAQSDPVPDGRQHLDQGLSDRRKNL